MRRKWRKAKPKEDLSKQLRSNWQIKVPEVFLIDENGERVGNMPTNKAIQLAEEAGLDLVEVNPKADPPVVKIVDFGQLKYETEKRAQKQKALQKKVELKEIRLSVRISQHDFDFRLNQALKFLEKGNKLKLEILLKGREKAHPEKAIETIMNFIKKLEELNNSEITKEQDLTKQGGKYTIILMNKNK
jgi:translation initiation factor IF-3